MYAQPSRLRGLAGAGHCDAVWYEMNGEVQEEWCQDLNSFGEPIGEPYLRSTSVRTHVDSSATVDPVTGAVTEERTSFVVDYETAPPAPGSEDWDAYVDAARAGVVYTPESGSRTAPLEELDEEPWTPFVPRPGQPTYTPGGGGGAGGGGGSPDGVLPGAPGAPGATTAATAGFPWGLIMLGVLAHGLLSGGRRR